MTARRMISGDVLKYRNGFLIHRRYEIRLTDSSQFTLTPPAASFQGVKPRLGHIAARSVVVLIKHQGIGDVFWIYALAQRDNEDFRLAFIPPEFDVELKEPFDQNYMSALYDLGYEIGRPGDFWLENPPGVIP